MHLKELFQAIRYLGLRTGIRYYRANRRLAKHPEELDRFINAAKKELALSRTDPRKACFQQIVDHAERFQRRQTLLPL